MHHIREGFKGQRLITISPEIISNSQDNLLTKSLYVKKIGFNPQLKFHYIKKDQGVDYYLLFYCTNGEGWYSIEGKTYKLTANQYFILPPNTPYSYGANPENPWTTYWVQFSGTLASGFYKSYKAGQILPETDSRLQDRIQLYEEIYSNLELSYHSNHYIYASICLFHFLGSFRYPEQFRRTRKADVAEHGFSQKVIYYMRENVENNLTLSQIAMYFNLSPSRFSAIFQQKTGQSPIKYFILLKMEKACQYLELSNLKITEIYPKLGFHDGAYFSKIFTKAMGVPPSRYRERERLS
jgi:AraC family transcriptional regulator, arabinose operon regulatory protein